MNNHQFRKLVLDDPSGPKPDGSPHQPPPGSALGGKRSALMPMAPRTVRRGASGGGRGVDFAQQVRERNGAAADARRTKKFKSSAPEGSRFVAGYTDRAKARAEAEEVTDDRAERIQALEEQMKLGEISPELFEELRDRITGGDVSSTHLVKGLDRRLLERVRRGENVFEKSAQTEESAADVDDELDKWGERDVETVKRERTEKKGTVAGRKRTRDEIMAELKAQRAAAREAAKVVLDESKWRKVGDTQNGKIEIDHKGREVLITVDEDGVVKRKVRKIKTTAPDAKVDKTPKTVLGEDAVVPQMAEPGTAPADDSDDDIFDNVGAEYNPLGDDSSDGETQNEHAAGQAASQPEDENAQRARQPRNYFSNKPSEAQETEVDRRTGIENIIKKAAKMDAAQRNGEPGDVESDEEKRARLKKRAEMLALDDRDMEDMDMGFGSSRFEDEEEGAEGSKVRLSQWKGDGGKGDEGWDEREKGDRKKIRKPKKRKGDVNNAADIMRVIEGRRAAGK